MNMNLVVIGGNLTRDPELRFTPKGLPIATFSIAINRKTKVEGGEPREEVTFVEITFLGKVAETVAQHFRKGQAILIQGRLKQDQWEDKQTGAKRSKLHVIGDSFQFCGQKQEGQATTRPAPTPEAAAAHLAPTPADESDDVPF